MSTVSPSVRVAHLTITGFVALGAACAAAPTVGATAAALTAHVPGDFNWDNQSDLLFQRRTDMTTKIWAMNGAVTGDTLQSSPVGPAALNWGIVATPDLSGDGRPDYLFQNENSGRLVSWFLDENLERTWGGFTDPMGPTNGAGQPTTGREVRGSSQINDDEDFDICFHDNANDQTRQWLMTGMTRNGNETTLAAPPLNYLLQGCNDFSGDGLADLVFLTDQNRIAIWEHDFADVCPGDWCVWDVGPPPATTDLWRLGAIGDYNGDGHLDLVFQAPWTGGAVDAPMRVWFMHYYHKVGEAAVTLPSGSQAFPGAYWKLVGPK